MAINPLTGTDDGGSFLSDIDRMNALALGPAYAPRDPSLSAEAPPTISAGAGPPISITNNGAIHLGDQPVGSVKYEHGDTHTRIANIDIRPDYQNQGIGTAVIQHIQNEAADRGNPVVLSTDAMRGPEAQANQARLYERLGFVPNTGPNAVSERIGGHDVREELVWHPPAAEESAPAPPPTPARTGSELNPDAPGFDSRVSTTLPTSKAALKDIPDPHTNADNLIGLETSRQSPDAYANNALAMRSDDYPDLPVKGLRNPESIVQAAINHMRDNLVWLHGQMVDKFGQAMVDRASQWYDGANAIALRWADQYGRSPEQISGTIANLSPQKDWYQNVSLAGRLIDVVHNHGDDMMTPEMYNWARNYIEETAADADTPTKQAAVDDMRMSLEGARKTPFNQINDPDTRALWVRAYDEAHNSRDYPIVTPEGDFADTALTDKGEPRKVAWGSFTEIKKALQALEAGDVPAISRTLGGNHKVRSFNNNIISPNAGHDVTIDTHAIAAAHGRPLSGNDIVVKNGLGMSGSSSADSGSKGLYGVYAEAYRRAAAQLGLLPRQLQSITWEGVRGLFSPVQKRDTQFWNDNYDIWRAFKAGKITADQARAAVLKHANGIEPPSWWTQPNAPGWTPPVPPETR